MLKLDFFGFEFIFSDDEQEPDEKAPTEIPVNDPPESNPAIPPDVPSPSPQKEPPNGQPPIITSSWLATAKRDTKASFEL